MNVLSLFDGISCGRLALEKAGIKVDKYIAYEIEETGIEVSKSNWDDIEHHGDVTTCPKYDNIDLLIGGSPCKDLSGAMKNREGLAGKKSKLFFEFVRIWEETKPKYFFFENVGSMPKSDMEIITGIFGVEPIKINSKLVSAALRNRLYWTNIPDICQPEDTGVKLQDILESGYTDREKARALLSSDSRPLRDKARMMRRYYEKGFTTIVFEDPNLTQDSCRYLSQIELERCMNLPDGYTRVLNRDRAAFHIGNGWTVDVIAHLFKGLKNEYS